MTNYEVRRFNPEPDDTEWIVVPKETPTTGWPTGAIRVPWSSRDLADKIAAILSVSPIAVPEPHDRISDALIETHIAEAPWGAVRDLALNLRTE